MDELLAAKTSFTPHELSIFTIEYEKKKKSKVIAWLLWLFFGGIGAHRYYLGHIGKGIAMTLTLGGLGVWTLINAFFINTWTDQYNQTIEKQIIEDIIAMRSATTVTSTP